MDHHRCLEVAGREFAGDMSEVQADLLLTFYVFGVGGLDFNRATCRKELKMVHGFFMGEAHHLIAALVYFSMVVVGLAENYCGEEDEAKEVHMVTLTDFRFRICRSVSARELPQVRKMVCERCDRGCRV